MTIILGDCLEVMHDMDANSISAIVTDPPYGLSFMGKGWDYAVPGVDYWKECLRVSKPGSFLIAMGGTRTFHRLTCAIEDAGWEIRDCISYLYGSGFPKSHNHFGIEGYGTALKPAWEPCIIAMKPCEGTFKQNAEKWGQAGINIDGCRIEGNWNRSTTHIENIKGGNFNNPQNGIIEVAPQFSHPKGRWPANVIFDEFNEQVLALKNNIPCDIISVIREYYCDYKLPCVRKENTNISKSYKKEKSPVLQPDVLFSCTNRKNEEAETSNVGEETQEGICSKDEREQADVKGEIQSQISGSLVWQGISLRQSLGTNGTATDSCQTDDETSGNSGTSNNNGYFAESSLSSFGSCTSSQWGEGRQQDREFGNDEQFDSQNGAQADTQGIARFEIGERALKVLACDVPGAWLKYFIKTGEEIRSPYCSAEMLDGQSGVLKSGELKGYFIPGESQNNQLKGKKSRFVNESTSDSGGASRFFYCAKASSGERNEGLDGLPDKMCHRYGEKAQGPLPQQTPSKGVIEKNNHPTVKPLKLMEYLIKLVMPPKDGILLDPFCGSGTTILAAKKLGFKAIGIEKCPEYCEIARARLDYDKQMVMALAQGQ